MTENLKLTREQQLAEWRKRQKQKSQQNLKTWGTRVKKDFLKMRLRFWGGILMVIGFMTSALNLMFLLGEDFDGSGECPWAGEVLRDAELAPEAKMDRLYERMRQQLGGAAAQQ